jgi:SAM-dependent methyltransferase
MSVAAPPCVICGSIATVNVFTVEPSVSTDRQIFPVPVQNQFCNGCGAVWNEGGARIDAPRFYAEQYDLLGDSALSEFQVHVDGGARGESDAILEFLERSPFAERGTILEIGCGKGVLLGKFLKNHPGWSAYAVEPSLNATEYFKKILPDVAIHEGPFETAPFRDQKFDFVAISGVMEHVPRPVEFLALATNALAPGGRAYIGVPNFLVKPDDLFVFDHLTRFTPDTLDELYRRTGLELERRDARDDRVWLWDVIRRAGEARESTVGIAAARNVLDAHLTFVNASLASFEQMLADAKPGETLALYGLGVLGLWARSKAGERAASIRYLLDDNAQIWGSRKAGLEIRGSKSIPELGISRVFLAANPCYHKRMSANLIAAGVAEERIYG